MIRRPARAFTVLPAVFGRVRDFPVLARAIISIAPCGRRGRLRAASVYYVFLLVVAVLAIVAYLLLVYRSVPGAVEERLGVLEPLPDDLGVWKADVSPAAEAARAEGLCREVRTFLDQDRLIEQTRYRNLESGEIVRVDKDRVLKRKRIKPT